MNNRPALRLLIADGIADGGTLETAPGALLIAEHGPGRLPEILAAGRPDTVRARAAQERAHPAVERLAGAVLIPGLVNAHAHLDLTALGPRPYDHAAGFAAWLDGVRTARAERLAGADDRRSSVRDGIERSIVGGVVAVADIAGAGHTEPVDELRASPLIGQSAVEFFGLGPREADAASAMRALAADHATAEAGVDLGLQPHAPYSAGPAVYEAANQLARTHGLRLATHAAESIDERRFVARCEGPIAEFLERIGVLDAAAMRQFGAGRSPVEHLAPILRAAPAGKPWLLAHGNDVGDADIDRLAECGAGVVLCPRAHDAFGRAATLGPHRYRDMLAAGIPVALGTDSVLTLPPAEAHRLSTLDEMRALARWGERDPAVPLAMATTLAAKAIGLDESRFTLAPGLVQGIAAVDVGAADRSAGSPRAWILSTTGGVRLIAGHAAPDRAGGRPSDP